MTRYNQFFICLIIAFAPLPVLAKVAYVYVPTPKGIYAFDASSAGKLTLIKGSPFPQVRGIAMGNNGTHFISVEEYVEPSDNPYLYSYDVAPDGAIGKEVSKVNLHTWCSYDEGAEFDHTGENVYLLDGELCGGGLQSFSLSKTGELKFEGSVSDEQAQLLPTITGNDKFAYAVYDTLPSDAGCASYGVLGFARGSGGVLQRISCSEADPTPPSGYKYFQAGIGAAGDPTNHLATAVFADIEPCDGEALSGVQIASYTVGSQGDLVSTNTWKDMPTLAWVSLMKTSPAGNLLAVATGTGVQFFHFNGAKPITEFTGILGTTGYISQMSWDTSNRLYAVNGHSGKLHVYDVTTTSAKEAPGSPYVLPLGATGMVVFSR